MEKGPHPSLVRVYNCPDNAQIAYFDETYIGAKDGEGNSFYAVTASIYRRDELEALREDLIGIVDNFFSKPRPYWHSTEAIRTEEGREKYTDLLAYLSENSDVSFITCQTSIELRTDKQEDSKKTVGPEEDARRECIKKVFEKFLNQEPNLKGLVFEKRREQRDNDRDKSFLKSLAKEGKIPRLERAWVSPYDEVALWVPDIAGLAYRHKRLMSSTLLGSHFDNFLSKNARVYEFDPPQ